MNTQKLLPCLWFDRNAEEAIRFYIDVFNGSPQPRGESGIISINRYESGMEVPGGEEMLGQILTAIFTLDGQKFMALDGGPIFQFNESISFYIECEDQEEVDYFYDRLSAVPESEVCGWLKDRFGLSWQVIPRVMGELLTDSNSRKALAATNAMLGMKKIIIADLQKAFDEA